MHTYRTLGCLGFLLGALVSLAGCGYQLSGQAGMVPATLRQLSVPMFTNKTTVPGIERLFTAAVRERLLRDGRVTLATAAGGTATLRGEVTGYRLQVLATNRDDRVLEYRVQTDVRITVE
ncbi:MAG: LPS assembly lipoprotein LptE, partial [Candidatus Entotheonellia bacterium]